MLPHKRNLKIRPGRAKNPSAGHLKSVIEEKKKRENRIKVKCHLIGEITIINILLTATGVFSLDTDKQNGIEIRANWTTL